MNNRKLISVSPETYKKLIEIKHKKEQKEQKIMSFDEVISLLLQERAETTEELIEYIINFILEKAEDFEEKQKMLAEIIAELVNEYSGIDDTIVQIKALVVPAYTDEKIKEITIYKDEEALKLLKEMEEEKQEEN